MRTDIFMIFFLFHPKHTKLNLKTYKNKVVENYHPKNNTFKIRVSDISDTHILQFLLGFNRQELESN